MAFCQQNGVHRLDLLPVYEGQRAQDLWASPMDFHPNEIAHGMATDALFAHLEEQGLLAGGGAVPPSSR